MKITAAELPQKLTRETPSLACIVGDEAFLRRESIQAILSAVHGENPPPEDVTRLSGSNKPKLEELTELFDDLRTPSLFGGSRSVILEQAEAYLALDPDAWLELIGAPLGSTLVVVVRSLDGRTKVAKALKKHGWIIEANRPFHRPPPWKPHAKPWEHDLNRWIVARAQKVELKLTPPDAHYLQTRVGTDLGELASTLERISTFLQGTGDKKVTSDLIAQHTPDGEESQLFELVDTFFLGDRVQTLRMARSILSRGSVDSRGARVTDPSSLLLQFVGAALRRVRQLREVHRTISAGGGDEDLMRNAGIAKPFLPRLKQQAKASPPEVLAAVTAQLHRADIDLKSGRGPKADELLERIAVAGRNPQLALF